MGTTSAKDSATAEAILVTTRHVIAERGPAKLTMSAIADGAGVSRPTLYRWFPSKDDLLKALSAYEEEVFDARLAEVIAAKTSRPARLDAALRLLVNYLDGVMGPEPIGADPGFAIKSLASSLGPQRTSFARLVDDGLDSVPAVKKGQISREQAAELFLRLAYSHYLIPHAEPDVLLVTLLSFAGLPQRAVTRAAS